MGLMRFLVTPSERLTDQRVGQAYMTGLDRVPWPSRAEVEQEPVRGGPDTDMSTPSIESDEAAGPPESAERLHAAGSDSAQSETAELIIERAVSDSGCLHLGWPVPALGDVVLRTTSLRERPEPYVLPLELARGTLSQLRDQLADWQAIRLAIPRSVSETLQKSIDSFAHAVVSRDRPARCSELAEQTIALALEAGRALAAAYVEQSIAVRRRGGARLSAVLGVDLGDGLIDDAVGAHVLRGFNAANVPLRWRTIEASEGARAFAVADRQIQWCNTHGLRCFAGPLLRFDADALPDWLTLWEGDFENVLACATDFMEAVVERYRGKIAAWQCAGRINTGEMLDLSEQEKLQLTARSFELIGRLDPDRPRLLSIDRPWAEYMGRRATDFPPIHVADALLRAGLEFSGIVLEINIASATAGTLPRTPLQLNRQLDWWHGLGLPLYLSISAPSDSSPDPGARWCEHTAPGEWTTRAQQAWAGWTVPLMLAKPYVHGVFWNQLLDAQPHEFPHAGLFDAQGRIKPTLRTLSAIRRTHLK